MGSRRGFESHPRYSSRGRSSDAQSARLSGERPPVRVRSFPLHVRGGRGVTAASGAVNPEASVRTRPATPFHADAEHGRAQPAVTRPPPAVVVRLHPFASTPGDEALPAGHLVCTEEEAGSTPAVSTPDRSPAPLARSHDDFDRIDPSENASVRYRHSRHRRRVGHFRPLQASVVSTASTRPLYGRGAGSTPAGGSFVRP
jgi:hypothetical protein